METLHLEDDLPDPEVILSDQAVIPRRRSILPEPADTSSAGQTPEDPGELYGDWRGRIVAYDRELRVKLEVDSLGARVNRE